MNAGDPIQWMDRQADEIHAATIIGPGSVPDHLIVETDDHGQFEAARSDLASSWPTEGQNR